MADSGFNALMTAHMDAIRVKANVTGKLSIAEATEAVNGIVINPPSGGVDVSGVTATASDVLNTAKFVDNTGALKDGLIATVEPSLTGNVFTVKKGYVASNTTLEVPELVISNNGTQIVVPVGYNKTEQTFQIGGSGIDTSDATAVASQILNGATAYVNGVKITGNIPTVTATISANIVTVPAGYIATEQTLTVAEAAEPTVAENVVTIHKGYIAEQTTVTIPEMAISNDGTQITVPVGYNKTEQSFQLGGTGDSTVKFGYWTEDGKFQELDLSGDEPADSGTPVAVDAVTFDTGKPVPDYGGGEIDLYKCLTVDVGSAVPDYQNVAISGITSPADMVGEYSVNDPTDLGTHRVFRFGNYQLGYDSKNTAWCFNEGNSTPDYVSSVFYSKLTGMSTEDGSFANPIWWDSEGVALSDRTLTKEYNTGLAPWDDLNGYQGWNFYVRLKAGTPYTIGMGVPTGDDYWFDWYFYLKDTNGNTVASATEGTPVTIGGKAINVYLDYTPTEDGLFVIQAQEEMNGLTTPIACSPAPEISKQPSNELFDQTSWEIGGGINAGFEVVSAGREDCIQKFIQIEGNGVSDDSVWQSEDGTLYCYIGYNYDTQRRWNIYTEKGYIGNYIYQSDYFDTSNFKHPGDIIWNNRGSSSYGDTPITKITAMPDVEGNPVLTPIEMTGHGELGYATWSGEIMQQDDDGIWIGTGETKNNMKTSRFVPIPGNIYNEAGDVRVETYKGVKGALYSKGLTSYGLAKAEYVPELITDIRFAKICAGNNFVFGIDKEGCLYSWGKNYYGHLGLGDTTNRQSPVLVSNKQWEHVSCGDNHTAAIDSEGYLWTVGQGDSYQLCNGSTSSSNTFKQIGTKKWKSVCCIGYRTFLIDEDGYMWGAGSDSYGCFGNGNSGSLTALTRLGDKTWSSVWGFGYRTFAIDTDGYMWATGRNLNGCLGIGGSSDVKVFTQIDKQKWKMAASGEQHTIAINAEGYMYVMGTNNIGQLGTGDGDYHYTPFKNGNKKWKWVGAAGDASVAIDIYGKAYWFGGDTSYMAPYRAFTPQPYSLPGNCTVGAVYNYNNTFILTNE